MKHITVVAAIIKNDDKYLCMQRNFNKYEYISYKYEFPGGKIEDGETEIEALKREIREELEIDISIIEKITTVEHSYSDFNLTMHCYLCSTQNIDINLKEHINYKWATKADMIDLDWAAADVPILEYL